MLGAIIGDIYGSYYEYHPVKSKKFEQFPEGSKFTDDTVLTVAIADSILHKIPYEEAFYKWAERYPDRGYGQQFFQWLVSKDKKPYNSLGNGAAMRISAIANWYGTLDKVLGEVNISSSITHNHPEGIKGAQAVASAIYLMKCGCCKKDIKVHIEKNFKYDLSRKLDDIIPIYVSSMKAPDSVPEAIICFLEADNFEDALRNAVSLGGDADTQACIAGAIAEATWGIPPQLKKKAITYIPEDMKEIIDEFYNPMIID